MRGEGVMRGVAFVACLLAGAVASAEGGLGLSGETRHGQGALLGALVTGWEATFPAGRVGTHLDGQPLIVVAAGDPSSERDEAASALEAAARASGRASLVLNGRSVGDLERLDDPAIVKRCAALPVKRVLVVRVFEGTPPNAVVAIYDTQGTALGAFAAAKGRAIDAKESSASEGVSLSAARTVEAVQRQGGTDSPAQRQFDEEYLWMADFAAVNQYGGYLGSWSSVYQGKYRKALDTRTFYELIERPDLVKRLDDHAAYQRNLFIGAGASFVGSILSFVFLFNPPGLEPEPDFDCTNQSNSSDCYTRQSAARSEWRPKRDGAMTFWGLSAVTLLTASMVIPMFALFGHPEGLPTDQARRAIDEYNAKLRKRLGLPPVASDVRPASPPAPQIRLAFGPIEGGAMGVLQVRF